MSRPVRSVRFRRLSIASLAIALLVAACGWDPSRPFDREAPQVNDAIRAYDAGEAGAAADLLEDYLTTGACAEGNIGTPLRVRERGNGTFDLGLSLFSIAETYGQRFGDEENAAKEVDPNAKGLRAGHVECALRVVRAIAEDPTQAVRLRAHARYLEGNLLFLTAAYKDAVTAYDRALEYIPGMGDAGPIRSEVHAAAQHYAAPDPVGRDAAWNRAVALRRIEDKKDAGPDAAPPDGGGDGGKSDENSDGGKNEDKDAGSDHQKKDGGKDDSPKDAGGKDSGSDEQNKPPPKKDPKDEPKDKEPPPPSRQSQDERILDQLENAPTVQHETAKQRGKARKVRGGMADK